MLSPSQAANTKTNIRILNYILGEANCSCPGPRKGALDHALPVLIKICDEQLQLRDRFRCPHLREWRRPDELSEVVSQLASLSPRFVVVSGDATSGNPDDGASRDKVALWWRAFRGALQPLTDAGIPVIAIAGNHDYYTQAQRDGYQAAWASLSEEVSGDFILSGKPPLYYSLQVDELHLLLLHVVDQDLPREVRDFMQKTRPRRPVMRCGCASVTCRRCR